MQKLTRNPTKQHCATITCRSAQEVHNKFIQNSVQRLGTELGSPFGSSWFKTRNRTKNNTRFKTWNGTEATNLVSKWEKNSVQIEGENWFFIWIKTRNRARIITVKNFFLH